MDLLTERTVWMIVESSANQTMASDPDQLLVEDLILHRVLIKIKHIEKYIWMLMVGAPPPPSKRLRGPLLDALQQKNLQYQVYRINLYIQV